MKLRNKVLSIICVVAILLSSCVTLISAYDTPVDKDMWEDPHFSTDHAYSIAFVGDPQYLTVGDYYMRTNKLYTQFDYIAKTVSERKLQHVFILGDMTDLSYKNDTYLASSPTSASGYGEWDIVYDAVSLLNGKVTYQVNRGNHDDYLIDYYFNNTDYTSQFTDEDPFFTDISAKYSDGRARYWNIKDFDYGETKGSIVNSYKTAEICGTKYLFITIDFNPTAAVLNWVAGLLETYSDHKAIITTHDYLSADTRTRGKPATVIGSTKYKGNQTGKVMWDTVFSKYENVFMIVSGHTGSIDLTYSYKMGDKGNKVLQVLVDPQKYDTQETDANGTLKKDSTQSSIQDTGMVLYMNFSADGKTITFDYYSTLLGKFLKNNNYAINLETESSANADKGDIHLSTLEAYGQQNAYITRNSQIAPVLDGAIGDKEYSATKFTPVDSSSLENFESDLEEWFAKDEEYIYYAFRTVRKEGRINGWPWQLYLMPGGWFDKDASENDILQSTIQFGFYNNNILRWNPTAPTTMSHPRWEEDIYIAGTIDSETGEFVVEFKISLEYFKMNDPDFTDLDSLGYMLCLNQDGNGNEVWYRWNDVPAEVAAQMGTDPEFLPQYIVDCTNIKLETSEKASVRLSSQHSGLRFKTKVRYSDISTLIATYGENNVSVGTLIAPADMWTDRPLRHENGTLNVDYIDVVATVGKPFQNIGGYSIYAGSISDIAETNYERDFIAVGYIKVVDGDKTLYTYSDVTAQKSVFEVAERAYYDVSNVYDAIDYKHTITDKTDFYYGKKDIYTPYTDAQRKILFAFIAHKHLSDPFDFDPYS